jgi:4-hydroxy-3-methylbut-2-enyl diphosphate reductase
MNSWFSIFTAYPRGYCAWVHRAVGMLIEVLNSFPNEQIYVNHEIIHNDFVIRLFEKRGVIFEPDIEKIPTWALVVISAHGIGPSYFELLRSRWIRWVDATCPLVEKVHREAREFIEKWYHILYIGKKWHQEALWVIDEWEKYFTLIEKSDDVDTLHFSPQQHLALLTQTTLSIDDTTHIIETIQSRFPQILLPKASDICYATTNRQRAVKVLADSCDRILVVGSKSSSNSNKLRDVAEKCGVRAYLIDDAREIDREWFMWAKNVWVTAGASWPEELVEGVLGALSDLWGVFVEELRVVEEKVEFPYILKILS